jgi:glycosyltransferase involved in cell wall biosynthesis
VGPVGRDALRHWLAKASLLILPSIEDNCPMVILEAMAAGVPVAASRIGGIPDLVTEHITGRLFDPRQSEDIAQTVDSILSDRDLSLRMQLQSRLYAMENFHPHVIATRHLEIYRDLLSE